MSYLIITLVVWFPNPVGISRHRDSAYIQPSSLSLYVVGFLSDAYLPGKPIHVKLLSYEKLIHELYLKDSL